MKNRYHTWLASSCNFKTFFMKPTNMLHSENNESGFFLIKRKPAPFLLTTSRARFMPLVTKQHPVDANLISLDTRTFAFACSVPGKRFGMNHSVPVDDTKGMFCGVTLTKIIAYEKTFDIILVAHSRKKKL